MKTYLVGGAVRDLLLGGAPTDRDYVLVGATQADLDALLASGHRWVGADFPVLLAPNGDQLALARRERKVGPGYGGFVTEHGADVSLAEDLLRRDLTVNAMALDLATGEVIDPFGGQADLRAGVLRHVSPAFAEDPLRVVRLARFAGRLGFEVARETAELARAIVAEGRIDELPAERMWAELGRGLTPADRAQARVFVQTLGHLGVLQGCAFYRDLVDWDAWSGSGLTRLAEAAHHLGLGALTGLPAEEREGRIVALFAAAASGSRGTTLPSATRRAQTLAALAPALAERTPAAALSLVARAGRKEEAWADLMLLASLRRAFGAAGLEGTQLALAKAVSDAAATTVVAGSGLKGGELGAAIKAAQAAAVEEALGERLRQPDRDQARRWPTPAE
jgi:hypothetical protein